MSNGKSRPARQGVVCFLFYGKEVAMYTYQTVVRYEDLDAQGRVKIPAILNYLLGRKTGTQDSLE